MGGKNKVSKLKNHFFGNFQNVTVLVTDGCYTRICKVKDCEFWNADLPWCTQSK